MEAAGRKSNTLNREQAEQGQTQTAGKGKETGKPQAWWEQLAGTLSDDKEGVKGWFKLLSNPLIVAIGLFLLGYWLFTQQRQTDSHKEQEVKRLRKKNKKLKKRMRKQATNEGDTTRLVVLD